MPPTYSLTFIFLNPRTCETIIFSTFNSTNYGVNHPIYRMLRYLNSSNLNLNVYLCIVLSPNLVVIQTNNVIISFFIFAVVLL